MKTFRILSILLIFNAGIAQAQEVQGKITINKSSEISLNIEDPCVVNLFKDFKQDKYQIIFFFEGKYETKDLCPAFSFFSFKTTVIHNGKTIKTLERAPMPYIPGGMFLAPETFHFINILATYQQEGMAYDRNTGLMPSGEYEIILEAVPVEAEGNIAKGIILFRVD